MTTNSDDVPSAMQDDLHDRLDELREAILDIDAHATPFGDIPDEPGWVGRYLVTAGALHRALGKIGRAAPSCQAEAECARLREALERIATVEGEYLEDWDATVEVGVGFLRSIARQALEGTSDE